MMRKKNTAHTPIVEGASYMILSARSGKAMEAAANNRIEMTDVTNAANQFWSFEKTGDAWKIVNLQSGTVADVILSGVENGSQIHQWEDVAAENQKWLLEPVEDGCYKIKSLPSGRCMDIVGLSDQNGAPIQIWDDLGGDNQLWRIVDPNAPKEIPAEQADAEKPAVKRTRKPAAKTEEKVEPKATEKAAKPAAKAESKPTENAAKPTTKAEPKAAAKSAPKSAAKTVKAESKAEPKKEKAPTKPRGAAKKPVEKTEK